MNLCQRSAVNFDFMAIGYLLIRRGVRTLARTINLAEPKTCERPRRVQKLVSLDVQRSCPHNDRVPTGYRPPRAVPVRICRRKDLERACQIKFCACPQKPLPKSAKQVLCEVTILGTKVALAGGLVYWTVSEGIWGDSADSEEFYHKLRETFVSDANQDSSLPHLEYIKFKILDTYNRTIFIVMGTLADIPIKINKMINDALFPCEPIEPKKKWW